LEEFAGVTESSTQSQSNTYLISAVLPSIGIFFDQYVLSTLAGASDLS
jgi:hypothetical protein